MTDTILVLRPMKKGDPTQYTYQWAEEAIKMANSYGNVVIDIKKDEVTYDNVSKSLKYYQPKMLLNFSHGCPTSIQGQKECVITRKFDVNELVSMPNFRDIVMPLIYASGCQHTCKTMPDICNPVCTRDTNVGLLRGMLVYAVSCYTGLQLGNCAVKYGAESYVGYGDLLLFPVDDMKSEDIFRDVHLVFIKNLLEGRTVQEASDETNKYEDELISFYKTTKYISLPLLWNKLNRKVLGNSNARLT